MGEVIAVLSGKGGTGKTSVCAGIATALAEESLRILCIDCDVGLRNLDISLGLSEVAVPSFLELMEGNTDISWACTHPSYPTLRFFTAPMNCSAEDIDPDAFCSMLRRLRSSFDYIFLDAPAGVEAGFRFVSRAADRFLVVTGSGPASIRDASRVGDLLELMGKRNVRLVVNRIDPDMLDSLHLTIDDVMDDTGLPLTGLVPEDPNVTLAAAFHKPVLLYAKRSRCAKAFRRIAKRVQGFCQPVKL